MWAGKDGVVLHLYFWCILDFLDEHRENGLFFIWSYKVLFSSPSIYPREIWRTNKYETLFSADQRKTDCSKALKGDLVRPPVLFYYPWNTVPLEDCIFCMCPVAGKGQDRHPEQNAAAEVPVESLVYITGAETASNAWGAGEACVQDEAIV